MPSTFVYGAGQMPIETKKVVTNVLADNPKDVWMQALQDKCKHIDNVKKYDGEQGGMCSLQIKNKLLTIVSLVLGPCKYPSPRIYNSVVILGLLLLHLMRLMIACSIHHKGTYMLDLG